ncbi:MAG: DUF6687 family protein, partial [Acidimicrobiales bacterium]
LTGRPGAPEDYSQFCAARYTELLGRRPQLLEKPESHADLWREEDAFYAASEEALAGHHIRLEEVPGIDLVVATVPEDFPGGLATRFTHRVNAAVHPAALHNASPRLRCLVAQGRRYRVTFRYESWVKLVSRTPLPRVDLAPLVDQLNSEELGASRWSFDAVGALEPVLTQGAGEESSIAPERVRSVLEAHLGTAPAAWDPYG